MPDLGQQQQSISESIAGIPANQGQPSAGEPTDVGGAPGGMSPQGSPYEIAAPQGVAGGYTAYGQQNQQGQQYTDTSGRGYWYQPGNVGAPGGMMTDLSKPMTVAESASKGLTGLVGTIDNPAQQNQQSQIGQVPGTTQPQATIAQGVVAPAATSPDNPPTTATQQGGTGSETPPVSGQDGQTAAQTTASAAGTAAAQPISAVGQLWPAGSDQGQQVINGIYQAPPGWQQVTVGGGSYLVGPDNVTTYSFNPQTGYITPFSGYVNGQQVRDYITSAPAATAPSSPTPGTTATAPAATAPLVAPAPAPTAPPAAPAPMTPTATPAIGTKSGNYTWDGNTWVNMSAFGSSASVGGGEAGAAGDGGPGDGGAGDGGAGDGGSGDAY